MPRPIILYIPPDLVKTYWNLQVYALSEVQYHLNDMDETWWTPWALRVREIYPSHHYRLLPRLGHANPPFFRQVRKFLSDSAALVHSRPGLDMYTFLEAQNNLVRRYRITDQAINNPGQLTYGNSGTDEIARTVFEIPVM